MPENLYNLGALTVVFLVAVREFFAFLKVKKNGTGGENHDKKVFDELKLMNENHLHSIEKAIVDGNREIVKAVTDGNREIASALGRIEGGLRK